jgi:DNA integrity scanning protein DisA with diadenylate cyclase activity
MEETQNNIVATNGKPCVDFGMQIGLAKNNEQVEKKIFKLLCGIAENIVKTSQKPLGALIVLGDFEKHGPVVGGVVQMKPKQNPIDTFKIIDTEHGAQLIKEYSQAPYDGAIVLDKTGQILGVGVYLIIEHPTLDIPDDCGTRHKAAASFSMREDVISVFTLSEETNIVRIWKEGKAAKVFRVDDEKSKTEDEDK